MVEQILNIYAIRAIILLPMLIVKQKRKSDEWRHRTESDGCHGAELEKGKMGGRFQTLSEDPIPYVLLIEKDTKNMQIQKGVYLR